MKVFQEITVWDSDFAVPNHVYFLSDSKDKMYGYVREHDGLVQVFKKPHRFHTRGRKFKEVPDNWNVTVDETEPVEGRNWTVAGSKGASYTVTENHGLWTCTCSGFKFRNRCRHVSEISNTVSDPA
jgi:hypothetical protein